MATSRVEWFDDRKAFDALRARVKFATTVKTTMGVHGDAAPYAEDGNLSVAGVAAVHEFGTDRIPERSFLRAGIDGHIREIGEATDRALDMIVTGPDDASVLRAAGYVGEAGIRAIQDTIEARIPPPLAPMTKAARDRKAAHGGGLASLAGQYTPLVDTGHLRNSIVYKVSTGEVKTNRQHP